MRRTVIGAARVMLQVVPKASDFTDLLPAISARMFMRRVEAMRRHLWPETWGEPDTRHEMRWPPRLRTPRSG